jgi:two-component system, sensor histidine kinase and response regulator
MLLLLLQTLDLSLPASSIHSLATLHRVLHYTLPHELRTPLTGILGFTELLLEDDLFPPDELREMAELISHSAKRLHA